MLVICLHINPLQILLLHEISPELEEELEEEELEEEEHLQGSHFIMPKRSTQPPQKSLCVHPKHWSLHCFVQLSHTAQEC